MRHRFQLVALLTVIALIATGCLGLSRKYKVSGIVTIDGDPPGDTVIEIAIEGRKEKVRANAQGAFKFELRSGTYTLVASGEGVKVARTTVTVQNRPVTGIRIDLERVSEKFYIAFDYANPAHVALIQKPWDTVKYQIKEDPFGTTALFFEKGSADQAPPGGIYDQMRFVVFDTPDIETFALSVDQLGEGGVTQTAPGGNRSLSMIFGYQDPANWWVAYYTYTNATRVARIKNGQQEYICRPLEEGQWWPNNNEYQNAYIRLERDGDEMVLRAYANGQPVSIDECRFDAASYTPGKIGLGGHSTSDVQSWYFKNVIIEEI